MESSLTKKVYPVADEKSLTLPAYEWTVLLMLAFNHGWHPSGTEADLHFGEGMDEPTSSWEEGAWSRSYFDPDGQLVTNDDARNLARALRRVPPNWPADAPEEARRHLRHRLRVLTEFCQAGGFLLQGSPRND